MLWVDGHSVSLAGVIALGVGVGYVAGMFGVGGGFLLTPLLNVVLGVPLPIAVGSSLCQMVGTALVALLRHRRMGHGEIRIDLLMLAGSVVGVGAGARALDALAAAGSVRIGGAEIPAVHLVLKMLYAVLLLGIAAVFWFHGADEDTTARPRLLARLRIGPAVDLPSASLRGVSALVVAYLGLALGFLSGLLGLGGGVALIPLLVYGFGFPIRQAAGTGILVLLATAATGTVTHALRGNVHLGLAMAILVGATISAQLGALATRRLPARSLKRTFAFLILVTVAAIVFDLARRLF